jgi:hypothetical protein
MPRFFTDPEGRVRPIRRKGTGAVVAGALALGMFSSGGGAISISAGVSAGEVGAVQTGGSSSAQLRARKSESQKAARKGDAEGAWKRMGLRQLRRTPRQQAKCLAASFGKVREFFTRHRCTSLDRVLFAVADETGRTAVVSVAWVGLANNRDARKFQTLMDEHGTGDITPLGAQLLSLADVTFTGLRYDSQLNGRTVTIAEAENAARGGFDHDTLDAIAEVAALLPRV